MDPNSKAFKELQAKWYKKLEKEGFEEIEQEDGNLKHWSSRVFAAKFNGVFFEDKKSYYESVETYYRTAGHFLNEYDFKSDKDRLIWELHSEGFSVREIVLTMKKKNFKVTTKKVYNVVKNLAKIMKGIK